MLKYFILVLWLTSCKAQSKTDFYGDWYNIGTERLIHFKFEHNRFGSDEKTFLFEKKQGKEASQSITHTLYVKNLVCLLREDSAANMPRFDMTVVRYNKELNTLDLLMGCSDESVSDTIAVAAYVNTCDTTTKMIMRFYPKATIRKFNTLKSVTKASPVELKILNEKLRDRIEQLTKEIGEDELLWVAPIIFQQALTELLIAAGYNPLLTEKQAEELFDFNYF